MTDARRPRRVAVVTGSRADYGLLRPTLKRLEEDPRMDLALVACAMHLSDAFGNTLEEVEADGFEVAARVPTDADDDAPGALGRRLAAAAGGFTEAFTDLEPDLVLLLGDRYEMLGAALAATGLGLVIAHVHGGELSEGSLDDAMRHSITKLAHIHFVAAREYGERVCQLGEQPGRVHVVGAAGLEAIRALEPLPLDELAGSLGVEQPGTPLIVATLHPASIEPERAAADAEEVSAALRELAADGATIVVTLPNDDPGNRPVRDAMLELASSAPGVSAHASLGQRRYLSLLSHADLVVGNSSSGLIEAPGLGVPVVNVGDRQRGRLRSALVIDSAPERVAVLEAARRGLDPAFREGARGVPNPYGDGDVSRRVVETLASTGLGPDIRRKQFADLPDAPWRARLELAEELA